MDTDSGQKVRKYYESLESRLGYWLFLKDAQHFAYYPDNQQNITEDQARTKHHDLIVSSLGLQKGSSVLDAGCGRGVVALDLARRYGLSVTGIDITPYIIQTAQARKEKQETNVKKLLDFKVMSYTDLEFPQNHFDGAYTIETLSHAPDLKRALSEIYRTVKSGGKFAFFEYKVADKNAFTKEDWHSYESVRSYSAMLGLDEFVEDNFVHLLDEAGYKKIKEIDISQNARKSFERLYNYAKIPYFFVKLLNLQKRFVNITAGVEYFKLAQKGLLKYCVYTAEK